MTDNELLQSISNLMDKKLEPIYNEIINLKNDMEGVKQDITDVKQDIADVKQNITGVKQDITILKQDMKSVKKELTEFKEETKAEFNKIYIIIENEIRKNINILAENYLAAARRYEKACDQFNIIQIQVDVIDKVVTKHSGEIQQLQKIS